MLRFSTLLVLILYHLNPLSALTTTIVVPCSKKHVHLIPGLLIAYREQTLHPNEIIISISEQKNKNPDLEEFLKNNRFPFEIEILYNEQRLSAGANRNNCASLSKSDLLILNDADDLPHPERVKILVSFFEKYDYDLIIHKYSINQNFKNISKDDIKTRRFRSVDQIFAEGYFHMGNIAMKKQVTDKLRWIDYQLCGEDLRFLCEVLSNRRWKCGMLFVDLINYRNQLSAGFEG